jgi:hypothetical protein
MDAVRSLAGKLFTAGGRRQAADGRQREGDAASAQPERGASRAGSASVDARARASLGLGARLLLEKLPLEVALQIFQKLPMVAWGETLTFLAEKSPDALKTAQHCGWGSPLFQQAKALCHAGGQFARELAARPSLPAMRKQNFKCIAQLASCLGPQELEALLTQALDAPYILTNRDARTALVSASSHLSEKPRAQWLKAVLDKVKGCDASAETAEIILALKPALIGLDDSASRTKLLARAEKIMLASAALMRPYLTAHGSPPPPHIDQVGAQADPAKTHTALSLDQDLNAVSAMPQPNKAGALLAWLPRFKGAQLTGPERLDLLKHALQMASSIRGGFEKFRVLQAFSPELGVSKGKPRIALQTQALSLAKTIPSRMLRCRAIAMVLSNCKDLPAAACSLAMNDAVLDAGDIAYEEDRSQTLKTVLPALKILDHESAVPLLAHGFNRALGITAAADRERVMPAWRGVVQALPLGPRISYLTAELSNAQHMPQDIGHNAQARATALGAIALSLADLGAPWNALLLRPALEELGAMNGEDSSLPLAHFVAGLHEGQAKDQHVALLTDALHMGCAMPLGADKACVLKAVAQALAQTTPERRGQTELFEQVLAASAGLENSEHRTQILMALGDVISKDICSLNPSA